jgi:hypothetical protein
MSFRKYPKQLLVRKEVPNLFCGKFPYLGTSVLVTGAIDKGIFTKYIFLIVGMFCRFFPLMGTFGVCIIYNWVKIRKLVFF